MPERADWEAATPKCPRPLRLPIADGRLRLRSGGGRCGAALKARAGGWVCPEHGAVKFGEVLPLPLVASSAER